MGNERIRSDQSVCIGDDPGGAAFPFPSVFHGDHFLGGCLLQEGRWWSRRERGAAQRGG